MRTAIVTGKSCADLLPIVFISGYADPAGGDGPMTLHQMVRKPFRPADLQLEIEAALAAARAPAE